MAGRMLGNGELARKLYEEILRTSNYFLHNCKHFSVEVLSNENPTYEEISKVMNSVAKIVIALYDDLDPNAGQNASEYCALMSKMGQAIKNNDQPLLTELVLELERKPGL